MADEHGPIPNAMAMAQRSRALCHDLKHLKGHPDQLREVLQAVHVTVEQLQDVIHFVGVEYKEHADSATTMLGKDSSAQEAAVRTADMLLVAQHSGRALRSQLRNALKEGDGLVWPDLDPVAAEIIRDLRRHLG